MIAALAIFIAVASPLHTADDYVFAKPAITNAIRGIVHGDLSATNAPGTMRYEDIAFLKEAVVERFMLVTPNLTSNEFIQAVEAAAAASNSVLPSVEIKIDSIFPDRYIGTNRAPYSFMGPDRFLSSPDILIEEPRIVTTNSYTFDVFDWRTNVYNSATNYIRQTMTNGTVNVWTNLPHAFLSNICERVGVVTNTPTPYADFCCKTSVVTIADTPSYKSNKVDLAGFYSSSTISNAYALVRAMRLSTPRGVSAIVATNENTTVTGYQVDPDGTHREYEPRRITSTVYNVLVDYSFSPADQQTKTNEGWESDEGYPVNYHSGYMNAEIPDDLELKLQADIADIATTYKADPPRILKAFAFAHVSVVYYRDINIDYSVPHGQPSPYYHERTNMHANVMIPLGEVSRAASKNGYLTFSASVPTTIFRQAAELAGIPFIEPSYVPTLPPLTGTPEWDESGIKRYKYSSQEAEEYLTCIPNFYLVLELNPKTKLLNWSEYE